MSGDTNQPHVTVLAIPGSLRRDSYNRRLLEAAVGCAPSNMRIQVAPVELLAEIPPFNEDLESMHDGDPDAVRTFRDAVRKADALLVSTPEYNQSIPGVMKNHIDWLSRPRPDEVLIGKPAAVMGATSGAWGTRLAQNLVRQALTSTEALVMPPTAALYIGGVKQSFSDDGKLDAKLRSRLEQFLSSFHAWIAYCQSGAQWPPQ